MFCHNQLGVIMLSTFYGYGYGRELDNKNGKSFSGT